MLEIRDLCCGYHGDAVVSNLSFSAQNGEIVCILGANGVGKTTLYRTILNILPALGGQVLIGGQDAKSMPREALAKRIAYVPQSHKTVHPYSVLDVITMGRTAHLALFRTPGRADEIKACQAMDALRIRHLAEKPFSEISGGERQLCYIARALTQDADILVMDEPTANLDLGRQAMILRRIHDLSRIGKTVLYSTHAPGDAFQCGHTVVALLGGSRYRSGRPKEVLTEALLREMYGVDVDIHTVATRHGSKEVCLPHAG